MTSNQKLPWHKPKETTDHFSIAERFTFSCSVPFRRIVASIFGKTRKTSLQRTKKRPTMERSLSFDDSAVWSDEDWEEATLIPHRRRQNLRSRFPSLVEEVSSNDDRIQELEDQIAALRLQISEREEREELLSSQLETSKNHTFALQGAIRDAVPPSVIADVSHFPYQATWPDLFHADNDSEFQRPSRISLFVGLPPRRRT